MVIISLVIIVLGLVYFEDIRKEIMPYRIYIREIPAGVAWGRIFNWYVLPIRSAAY